MSGKNSNATPVNKPVNKPSNGTYKPGMNNTNNNSQGARTAPKTRPKTIPVSNQKIEKTNSKSNSKSNTTNSSSKTVPTSSSKKEVPKTDNLANPSRMATTINRGDIFSNIDNTLKFINTYVSTELKNVQDKEQQNNETKEITVMLSNVVNYINKNKEARNKESVRKKELADDDEDISIDDDTSDSDNQKNKKEIIKCSECMKKKTRKFIPVAKRFINGVGVCEKHYNDLKKLEELRKDGQECSNFFSRGCRNQASKTKDTIFCDECYDKKRKDGMNRKNRAHAKQRVDGECSRCGKVYDDEIEFIGVNGKSTTWCSSCREKSANNSRSYKERNQDND